MFGRNNAMVNSKRAKLNSVPSDDFSVYDDTDEGTVYPDMVESDVSRNVSKLLEKETPENPYTMRKKSGVPMAIATVLVLALASGAAFVGVTYAQDRMVEAKAEQVQQAQAAEEARRAAEEEALLKAQEEVKKQNEKADAMTEAFGDRVIQLRPEQTQEEMNKVLDEAKQPGVDAENLSPETDGRAVWITLEEGDSLSALAEYFNTDVTTIMELNDFTPESQVFAGDMIRVG